jgi:phosphoribosylanthranilate isomerase
MLIKVCGNKYPGNMMEVAAKGPDMMGFIFYPGSPRYMANHLSPEDVKSLPSSIIKTGVFVNESCSEILRVAELYQLDAIQLHGTEIPEECKVINRAGFQIIKAFRIDEEFTFEQTIAYSSSCRFFLFDAYGTGFGGNGIRFNWEKLQAYNVNTPFLLSGGIDAEDVSALKQLDHPLLAGFDINSKFEVQPGEKDPGKIERFITTLRS